jgi:hypothetical protein
MKICSNCRFYNAYRDHERNMQYECLRNGSQDIVTGEWITTKVLNCLTMYYRRLWTTRMFLC